MLLKLGERVLLGLLLVRRLILRGLWLGSRGRGWSS